MRQLRKGSSRKINLCLVCVGNTCSRIESRVRVVESRLDVTECDILAVHVCTLYLWLDRAHLSIQCANGRVCRLLVARDCLRQATQTRSRIRLDLVERCIQARLSLSSRSHFGLQASHTSRQVCDWTAVGLCLLSYVDEAAEERRSWSVGSKSTHKLLYVGFDFVESYETAQGKCDTTSQRAVPFFRVIEPCSVFKIFNASINDGCHNGLLDRQGVTRRGIILWSILLLFSMGQ